MAGRVQTKNSVGAAIAFTSVKNASACREKSGNPSNFPRSCTAFSQQSNISVKNVARLKSLAGHKDPQISNLGALILEIARVLPGKRNRWLKLAQRHRPLFDQSVALLGVDFFGRPARWYGDFESPLWHYLEEYQSNNPF